ncbi:MAG TPA: hypothetical protein EYH48_00650 [Aquifex aeolicus]|uniref:Uncharacterized protein n=1 Tax=Aquifex aeolicus TaxID=63363 RepID=A0A9D1CGG5_AQUAO|nr:hypothetical protein [Aquificales bacterium]HIP98483.1 hypothetical protein [Aquifex aeolicus]HIQ25830.1 hypothetical protein [Aquifex aeolicus]
MGIYDRDYYGEESKKVRVERAYIEIEVQLREQQKLLDQIFDLIKVLREERKELLKRITVLEEENRKLWEALKKLQGLEG